MMGCGLTPKSGLIRRSHTCSCNLKLLTVVSILYGRSCPKAEDCTLLHKICLMSSNSPDSSCASFEKDFMGQAVPWSEWYDTQDANVIENDSQARGCTSPLHVFLQYRHQGTINQHIPRTEKDRN